MSGLTGRMQLRGAPLKVFQVLLSSLKGTLGLAFSLCLGWAVCAGAAQAAGRSFTTAAAPAWVTPIPVETEAPLPMDQIRNGVYYLLADRQVRVNGSDRQNFQHFAIKVVNDKGLEDAASVDIDYDPSYQRLTLHTLAVHRQGQVTSRLASAQIRTLQRERELEAQVLDGQLTVSITLKDVRVGDVVEYAYSLQGSRPVLQGHQSGSFDMQWRSPLHALHARLLWPTDRPLRVEISPGVPPAQERTVNGLRELLWTARSVPGLQVNDQVPAWYDPYPFVQWTSFRDWGEVSRWAVPLYRVPSLPAGELADEVVRIRQTHADPEDRLVAALRFVQQNIRYLSVAIGEGSYTPSPPALVMQRRFGDCKDKTLLTLTLLKALGVEAEAALVNTSIRKGVRDLVPSAGAFNHVLVRARIGSKWFWIDPTNDPQTGTLDSISQPSFGFALVVSPETRELEPMPQGDASSNVRKVFTTYDASSGIGKTATLTVTTELQGLSAERMRSDVARNNLDELGRRYLKFYGGYFPGIESAGSVRVQDNTPTNVVTVVERYRLPGFWTPGDRKGQLEAAIKAPDLLSALQAPDDLVRTAPLSVDHPVVVESFVEVRLPEDWDVGPEHSKVEHPAFVFADELTTTPRLLKRHSRYISLEDHVAPSDVAAYASKLKEARVNLGLILTHTPPTAAADDDGPLTNFGWPVAVYLLLLAAACYWLARKLYRYDPPDQAAAAHGAKPWGFGVVVFGAALIQGSLRDWRDIWDAFRPVTRDLWFHVVRHQPPESTFLDLVNFGCMALLLTALILQLVLYFGRRSSLPRVTYGIWGLLFLLTLYTLTQSGDMPFSGKEGSKALAQVLVTLLWSLYLYRSRRVKATFVRRYPGNTTATVAPLVASEASDSAA